MLVAAAHPDLVRALVMVEAGPGGPGPDIPHDIEEWLTSWSVPFASPVAAAEFFGGGLAGAGWAAGLEKQTDGWWPRFEPELMVRSVLELSQRSFWREWSQVRCPAVVVLAESGFISVEHAREMTRTRPGTVMVNVPGAGHDVHLEKPETVRTAITDFLTAQRVSGLRGDERIRDHPVRGNRSADERP
jgi:pimeloyl-ACP methyl ester carboxylesterase